MNKTLYLSDLDGTLLRPDEQISEYTASAINRFIRDGGCFSYATARSFVTASKVTQALNVEFPAICYNGAFIVDSKTGKPLHSVQGFSENEAKYAFEILNSRGIYPIVYSLIDGAEKFSYINKFVSPEMRSFLESRKGDPRERVVNTVDELYAGDKFNFTCIDTEVNLSPLHDVFKRNGRFICMYAKDIYSPESQWLGLDPINATKAVAALRVKEMLACERLVVFGDNINDIPMFEIADECYAVANAVPQLKDIATGIIGGNDEDGVAKFLETAMR